MALYEHVFLARQDITPQQVDALVEQYKGVIEANGGKVGRVENWGLKSLTYRIKKNRKAHYVLMAQISSARRSIAAYLAGPEKAGIFVPIDALIRR